MGKFDGKYIRGLVGPVIQRRTRHGLVVQSTPDKVNQTEGTKKAQGVFGQGSILACTIRDNLISVTQGNWDPGMVNRFNTPVRDVLKQCYDKETDQYTFKENSFGRLAGFEFNVKSLLINYLLVSPEVVFQDNVFKVTVPEIDTTESLRFPGSTNACEINIAFIPVALHAGRIRQPADFRSFNVQIDQGMVPRQEFEFVADPGCLCVAAIGLNYFTLNNGIRTDYNTKVFNPSGVIGAIVVPGVFVEPPLIKEGNKVHASPWTRVYKMKLPAAEAPDNHSDN